MLYFQSRPDSIFSVVVSDALEFALDGITTGGDDWRVNYERIGACMSTDIARREIRRLVKAHADEECVYQVTDYHWLLIFECLALYCEILNDLAPERVDGRFDVGGHRFRYLDFDAIVEVYFWDTDFLWTPEDLPTREAREIAGCSEQIFGIAHGLAPHPEELEFTRVDDPQWFEERAVDPYESDHYPTTWVD